MAPPDDTIDHLRADARRVLDRLRGLDADGELPAAKQLVEDLRNVRDYGTMGQVAEAVSRIDPTDPKNRRLYAQCLIEDGKATAAIDVLHAIVRRLPEDHPEAIEATGLLGRANKQIFFEAADKTSPGARQALDAAMDAYRGPFERTGSTWHGVNLLALLANARRFGMAVGQRGESRTVAARVLDTLERTPPAQRDEWFLPTLAEASLGLDDWEVVERNVRTYVTSLAVRAFHVASTLRQFTQIWGLEDAGATERGRNLVNMLRARLMRLSDGCVELTPRELERVRTAPPPDPSQLEAVLGVQGPKVYAWWKTGLDRARSVAAIRRKLGDRVGTGFLVRAGDLGLTPAAEPVLLTNFHVVNASGEVQGLRPEEAEVTFEAGLPGQTFEVAAIVWSSPVERHDATVLRLSTVPGDIPPLPVAPALPTLEKQLDQAPRVYVIGHPGGRDLAFSFLDNELLDHEGPTTGKPPNPDVWRVHYRAATEGGSSGSPVFNASEWGVIALHHKGGKLGMPRLNGVSGTYAANEGIALRSIALAPKG